MQTSENQRRTPPSDEASREETIRGLYTELALKAEAKIANVEAKIAMLKKIKQALTELSVACKGRTSLDECPILEFLDDGGGLE
jgi:hypothetical protein